MKLNYKTLLESEWETKYALEFWELHVSQAYEQQRAVHDGTGRPETHSLGVFPDSFASADSFSHF